MFTIHAVVRMVGCISRRMASVETTQQRLQQQQEASLLKDFPIPSMTSQTLKTFPLRFLCVSFGFPLRFLWVSFAFPLGFLQCFLPFSLCWLNAVVKEGGLPRKSSHGTPTSPPDHQFHIHTTNTEIRFKQPNYNSHKSNTRVQFKQPNNDSSIQGTTTQKEPYNQYTHALQYVL